MTEYKIDGNVDLPIIGCLVEYKSDNNADFSIIECLVEAKVIVK